MCMYKYVHVCMSMCHSMYVVVGGQLVGVGFLLLSCGCWGSNSHHLAWQQAYLPPEPSHQPY